MLYATQLRGSLAHKALSLFIITVITGSSLAPIIPGIAHAITVLPLESFGTVTINDIPNWDEEGTDSDSSTLAQAAGSGNDSASPDAGAFAKIAQGEWICREINAANREGLKLSYYWRGDSDAGSNADDGIVEYKAGSGSCTDASGWSQLQNHDMRDDASWTTQNAFNLPNSLDNTTFRLRFKANTNSSDEYFRVDGITITDSSNYAVTVNQPVSISGLTLTLTGTGEGTPYVGQLSAHDVQVNWGNSVIDNTSTTNFIDPAGGPKNFTGTWSNSITYAAAGIYTITVKLYHQTPPGAESSGDSVYSFQVNIPTPDACPQVPGTQTSGPCANDTCVQDGGTWNSSSCVMPPPPVDACPNVTGMQVAGPCLDAQCLAPNTWNVGTQQCVPPPVIDTDADTIPDSSDNCPSHANTNQLDSDNDGTGDPCDPTPNGVCPEGQTGTPPNCVTPPPPTCPEGTVGVPPACVPVVPEVCPEGTVGVPPACVPVVISCPEGQVGVFPNCVTPEPETCPEGQVGTPPNCSEPTPEVCPEGQSGTFPNCVSNEGGEEETSEPEVTETPKTSGKGIKKACGNNVDDDGDGLYDMNDPGCESKSDTSEENPIGGDVLGVATLDDTCSALITTYMHIGRTNDIEEVKKLQNFLNSELGLSLEVNGIFGEETENAVNAFQLKYKNEVLKPWSSFGLPENTPTGYVFKTTQRWINMVHCASLNIPMPELQ